ncbi:MAG: hypothetical protein ACP5MK_02950 [Candidatus Micrarchaeia archaeon]
MDAIVMSFDNDEASALPTGTAEVDIKGLVGKKVEYVDHSEKTWNGVVTGIDGSYIKIKFDGAPTSLGQGQIVEIKD